VLFYIETGGAGPDAMFKLTIKDTQSTFKKFMFGHTYPQPAWSYSNIEFAIPVNDMR